VHLICEMNRQQTLCFLFGALALVVQSMESLHTEHLQSMHPKIDADKDGKVSLAELVGFHQKIRHAEEYKDPAKAVDEMDEDGDKKVNLKEFLGLEPDRPEDETDEDKKYKAAETAKFKATDKDGNGLLDMEELKMLWHPDIHDEVHSAEWFKHHDKDGNGELSHDEFQYQKTGGDLSDVQENDREDFRQLDKDKSGTLSANEYMGFHSDLLSKEVELRELFKRDEDNDGHMSMDEFAHIDHIHPDHMTHHTLSQWAEAHHHLHEL